MSNSCIHNIESCITIASVIFRHMTGAQWEDESIHITPTFYATCDRPKHSTGSSHPIVIYIFRLKLSSTGIASLNVHSFLCEVFKLGSDKELETIQAMRLHVSWVQTTNHFVNVVFIITAEFYWENKCQKLCSSACWLSTADPLFRAHHNGCLEWAIRQQSMDFLNVIRWFMFDACLLNKHHRWYVSGSVRVPNWHRKSVERFFVFDLNFSTVTP